MRAAVLVALIAGLIVVAVVGGNVGCLRTTQFECSTNTECTRAGGTGTCEAVGFCSFDDASCDSGRRYGDLSGPFANQCLPPPDAAIPIDAAIDAYVHDARECFGAGAYELCFTAMPPMGPVSLAGTLDTTTDTRCATAMPQSWIDAGQPDACLIMGRTINVTGNLAVSGSRPLVLLADVITLSGVVDIASHVNGNTLAPGGNATQCAAFPTTPVDNTATAGGGAGGSFMRAGGFGGAGDVNTFAGGTAAPMDGTPPTILRGGCVGQLGGLGTGAPGAPGNGGGAIYLTASKLTLNSGAGINASGAGAASGGQGAGGSGGGAGGMIVIHAAETITASGARLLANGGGGAAGGFMATGGQAGSDPSASTPTAAAAGGSGPGGAGGAGAAGAGGAGTGGVGNNRAGGGGGGGVGYIQSNLALAGATVSPAATIVP